MPHCVYPTISNRIELPSISIWIQKCRLITKTRQRPFSTGHTRARIICRSTESKLMLDRSTIYLRSMKHFSCCLASYCNLFSIGLFDFGGCEFHARLYTSTSSLSTASFPLPFHSSVSVSSHSRVESSRMCMQGVNIDVKSESRQRRTHRKTIVIVYTYILYSYL